MPNAHDPRVSFLSVGPRHPGHQGENGMKAAIITAAGKAPVYGDFNEPDAGEGQELINLSASALSQFSKPRSSGAHYSSDSAFSSVAGADGVGRTVDGRRVYFVLPEAPYGALAEKSLVRSKQCVQSRMTSTT
jgi:hypothetical protein